MWAQCLLCRFRATFKAAATVCRCGVEFDWVIDQITKWPHQAIPPQPKRSYMDCNQRLSQILVRNNVHLLGNEQPYCLTLHLTPHLINPEFLKDCFPLSLSLLQQKYVNMIPEGIPLKPSACVELLFFSAFFFFFAMIFHTHGSNRQIMVSNQMRDQPATSLLLSEASEARAQDMVMIRSCSCRAESSATGTSSGFSADTAGARFCTL